MKKLGSTWKALKEHYKLTEVIGEGQGGQVVKAYRRDSLKEVAIKKIDCSFEDLEHMKYVLREISILRQLSSMDTNQFSTKLYDVIVPEHAYEDI